MGRFRVSRAPLSPAGAELRLALARPFASCLCRSCSARLRLSAARTQPLAEFFCLSKKKSLLLGVGTHQTWLPREDSNLGHDGYKLPEITFGLGLYYLPRLYVSGGGYIVSAHLSRFLWNLAQDCP